MFDLLHLLGEDRYKELLRESEQNMLIQQALENGQADSSPFYYEMLAQLGRQLTTFGTQLQERYGHDEALPCVPAAEQG